MATLPAGFTMFKHTKNRRGYIIVFNIKACRLLLSYLWRCGAAEGPSVGELHVLPNSRGFFCLKKFHLNVPAGSCLISVSRMYQYANRLMSDRSYQNVSLCQLARVWQELPECLIMPTGSCLKEVTRVYHYASRLVSDMSYEMSLYASRLMSDISWPECLKMPACSCLTSVDQNVSLCQPACVSYQNVSLCQPACVWQEVPECHFSMLMGVFILKNST